MPKLGTAFKTWVLIHRAPRNPLDESGVMLLGGGLLLAGIGYYYLFSYMPLMRIGGYDPWWLVGAAICWFVSVYLLMLMLRELWHLTVCRLQEIFDERRRLPWADVKAQFWINALLVIALGAFFYFQNGVINGLTWSGWPARIADIVVTVMLALSIAMPAFLAVTTWWAVKHKPETVEHKKVPYRRKRVYRQLSGWPGVGRAMSLTDRVSFRQLQANRLLSQLGQSSWRRTLRMTSGLVLFAYITAHFVNHALGLISLAAAEEGLSIAIEVWYSLPGTILLYGAAATHFVLALWAVYERRTFRLPPAELLRIALGFRLPVILINHFANTRLAYDLFGLSSDYTRVIANLWVADSQGMQLGLLAPGWLHGCLGLHFAFNRRPLYRRLRFVLFAIALLLPVFSALGFISMGKELSTNLAAAAAAQDYLGPAHADQRAGIARWHNQLVIGYFAIIGATFGLRSLRNLLERSRRRLISISYPGRTVRVPRGWSVLEASRGFHLPHASMCGGRARCSTCRVRVTAGDDFCPAPGSDEEATLRRIGAPSDVRLACQLRPAGDISVLPLVQTARPVYRPTTSQHSTERDVVVMYCDFLNGSELAPDQLPQDLLYLLTLYGGAISDCIRSAHGIVSSISPHGICAIFASDRDPAQGARRALQATAAIDQVIRDLANRLDRQGAHRLNVAISIHAGRAAVGEVGTADPPILVAVGEAVDLAAQLRKAVIAHGKRFGVSEPVTSAAGVTMPDGDAVVLQSSRFTTSVPATISDTAPTLPAGQRRLAERGASLRRLWSG